MEHLTPKKIVEELDKYIIGQNDAKKAVAIALRNRWRRQLLPDDLKDEAAYGVRVYGDSMLPIVKPGSIVIVSLEASSQNGDLAVVVTQDGEAMIKLVYYKGEELLLRSTNPAYTDRRIPRSEVLHLHPVIYIRMARL